MDLIKKSLFSSSNRRKLKKSRNSPLKNYKFRPANSSLKDPCLYSFDNDNFELETIDTDEESTSTYEENIRTRSARHHATSRANDGGSIVIVEKPVLPNETIQAFAIRYRVAVSQLKRLNNLQNDQEFHVLSNCRVPVHRFGLFHELQEASSNISSINDQSTVSLPVTHLSQQNHLAFLNAMDQDLALMRTKVEQLIETSSLTTTSIPISNQLTTPSLTNSLVKPARNTASIFNCDEVDCVCRSWHIVIIIILIILIPLIWVCFYIIFDHASR